MIDWIAEMPIRSVSVANLLQMLKGVEPSCRLVVTRVGSLGLIPADSYELLALMDFHEEKLEYFTETEDESESSVADPK